MESRGGGGLKAEEGGGARPFNEPLSRSESNRTLLDIIRDEGGGPKDGKKSWRHFKEKLRRHNSGGRGSNWTSTVPVPASDIPINNNNNRMMARHPSTRINSNLDLHASNQADIPAVPDARVPNLIRNSSISMGRTSGRFDSSTRLSMRKLQREENSSDEEEEDEEEEEGGGGGGESAEEAEEEDRPVRMSLMSLLAENDNGLMGYMDEEDDDDDEDDGGGGGCSVEYSSCCVCMVRHKGTAFEPCGHSFCRLCSRELGVQSGKCPLCNNYILEILDIF